MSKLIDIPVYIESNSENISMLIPILHELEVLLQELYNSGTSHLIDLRNEPLTVSDINTLKQLLGHGEIQANLTALGATQIWETSIAGIWWLTHFNQEGQIQSEFIEITTCPDMLKTSPDDLNFALVKLQDKISNYLHTPTPDQIAQRLSELGFDSIHQHQTILNNN